MADNITKHNNENYSLDKHQIINHNTNHPQANIK
jgi:hypothetical protein